MSSTVFVSSQWSTTTSHEQPDSSLAHVYGILEPRIAPAHTSFYVFPYCQHYIFQDTPPHWPRIHHHPLWANNQSSQFQGQQHRSSHSKAVLVCNACPHCWRQPKLPDHRFCSVACSQSAARSAPELKYLPPHHELSIKIATQFIHCWKSAPRPKVLAVYMITWSESSRRGFERYRHAVEARGQFKRFGLSPANEQKRFRSTVRTCTLGERGNVLPCHNEACWMCETIRLGFEPHLRRKRDVPFNGGGIRLGAGIYTSYTSSKADQYAQNINDPSSTIHAMLVCRVAIGKPYVMYQENPTIRCPPSGYDCVFGKSGWQSAFAEDEYVVYDADAIRAAYLVLYEKAPGH